MLAWVLNVFYNLPIDHNNVTKIPYEELYNRGTVSNQKIKESSSLCPDLNPKLPKYLNYMKYAFKNLTEVKNYGTSVKAEYFL